MAYNHVLDHLPVSYKAGRWFAACQKLTYCPQFNQYWKTPAFYPWYKNDLKLSVGEFTRELEDRAEKTGNYKAEDKAASIISRVFADTNEWVDITTKFFVPRKAAFPKILWLHNYIARPVEYLASHAGVYNSWEHFIEKLQQDEELLTKQSQQSDN